MALKAIIANLTDVDESLRGEYRKGVPSDTNGESADKFYLDVTSVDGFSLENVVGLKTVGSEAKSDRTRLKKELEAWKALNLSPADITALIAKAEEMKDWTPDQKAKEMIDAAIQQVKDKHTTEVGTLNDTIRSQGNSLSTLLVDDAVSKAMDKFEFVEGGRDLLRPHVQNQVRMLDDDNGKPATRVVNPDRLDLARVSLKSGNDGPMDVEELLATMQQSKTFAPCFKGTTKKGIGDSGDDTNDESKSTTQRSTESGLSDNPVEALGAAFKKN